MKKLNLTILLTILMSMVKNWKSRIEEMIIKRILTDILFSLTSQKKLLIWEEQ